LLMVIARHRTDRTLTQELAEAALALREPARRHAARRLDRGDRVLRERQVERSMLAAEEAGRRERLQFFRLPYPLESLADVDEGGNRRVVRTLDPRDPRAEVRRGDRLRRDVAGVPVILVPRVEDVAEIGDDMRADERRPIHDPRD